MLCRWWVQKYNLPANHRLYRKRTPASLMQEMFEDLYARREEVLLEMRGADGVRHVQLAETLSSLDKILSDPKDLVGGPMITGDPLVDEWEREIAEGKMPDLTKDLPLPRGAKPRTGSADTAFSGR